MLRKVIRGVLLLVAAVYVFSMFSGDWIDRLPRAAQLAVGVVILAFAALDVAAFASPTVERFLTGRDEPDR